ncbi:MAG: Phosphoribosylformylglycinamidine cyclo-ligase, partial [Candidatus Kaiserbacteria bacterium GW2011_GWC2_52_8b]
RNRHEGAGSVGRFFELAMIEWHVTPDYIVANWTDELLELMAQNLTKRKERERAIYEGRVNGSTTNSEDERVDADKLFGILGNKLKVGDAIIGAPSTGLHANGATLVIKRGLALPPDYFLTRLPNGKTFGEEALIPTRSYVRLVEALLDAGVQIHKILPGTGGGVSKIAVDRRAFTYRIHTWVEVPTLFQFMREIGVTLMDCLTTFNWGVGYYVFVPFWEVGRTIQVGRRAGYNLVEVGRVEEGDRQVIFEPEGGIKLPPPGE